MTAVERLMRAGFARPVAVLLARAGYDVVYVRVDALVGGA